MNILVCDKLSYFFNCQFFNLFIFLNDQTVKRENSSIVISPKVNLVNLTCPL